jgi:hypothetical protein
MCFCQYGNRPPRPFCCRAVIGTSIASGSVYRHRGLTIYRVCRDPIARVAALRGCVIPAPLLTQLPIRSQDRSLCLRTHSSSRDEEVVAAIVADGVTPHETVRCSCLGAPNRPSVRKRARGLASAPGRTRTCDPRIRRPAAEGLPLEPACPIRHHESPHKPWSECTLSALAGTRRRALAWRGRRGSGGVLPFLAVYQRRGMYSSGRQRRPLRLARSTSGPVCSSTRSRGYVPSPSPANRGKLALLNDPHQPRPLEPAPPEATPGTMLYPHATITREHRPTESGQRSKTDT